MRIFNHCACVYLILGFLFVAHQLNAVEVYTLESELAVDTLIDQVSSDLSKKYQIETIGTKVAMPGGVVKKLGLRFQLTGPLSVEALRKTLIESAGDFLHLVNTNERIKPFLEVYPFTLDRIQVILFLIDSAKQDIDDPNIGIAELTNGTLNYEWLLDVKGIPTVQKELKESYTDALKTLQNHSTPSIK